MMLCFVSVVRLVCALFVFRFVSGNGQQTAACVSQYNRHLVTRDFPPRNYLYFHETLDSEQPDENREDDKDNDWSTDLHWRIVGGKQVSIQEVPYQVLYGAYCGGSLIASDWVITAAHCKERETFILAGSTRRGQSTKFNICAHFTHPQWQKSDLHMFDYDYQLVLLEQPVPITASSRPIAIGDMEDIREGNWVSVSGWGYTRHEQGKMQDVLRRVWVPVMSQELCQSMPLESYQTVTPRMFCAGLLEGTKDACQGDSGGPAVWNSKLVGLVSFGIGCAVKEHPGVYSNIPLMRDWIREVTGLPL